MYRFALTQKRRRVPLLTAVVGVIVTALAGGAGTSSATPQGGVTLRFMAQSAPPAPGNPAYDAVIANFEKAYPNIDVRAEYNPTGQYQTVIRTQLQGGNAPDVFFTAGGTGQTNSVIDLGRAGYLLDLSKRKWVKRVPSNFRSMFYVGKRLYALPTDFVAIAPIYQPSVWRELGFRPPRTMRELLTLCDRAKARDKSLIALAATLPQNAGLLAGAIATNYVLGPDPNWQQKRLAGRVTFAGSPGWRKTLQTIVTMKERGCFARGVEAMGIGQAVPRFANGTELFWVVPVGAKNNVRAANPNAKFNAFALPADTAAATRMPLSPNNALSVNAKSTHKREAQLLVDFFAREGQSRLFAKVIGNISLHQAKTGKRIDPELSGIVPFTRDPKKTFPFINISWRGDTYIQLGSGVQGLLTGQRTVEQVLRAMDEAWDK